MLEHVSSNRAGERVLGVSVNVHLDNTVAYGGSNFLVGGAGATVHD